MSDLLARFKADPLGFLKRVLWKSILGRWIYRRGPGYDAQRYWEKRFDYYGPSLRAAGDEGFSEAENVERYAEDARTFLLVCEREGIELAGASVLEIGCGTGFYTGLLRDHGVERYLGVDITDRLFGHLRERFPSYEFLQLDITEKRPPAEGFGLVLMIDVIEHIVEEKRLVDALRHARDSLSPNGVFILAPVMAQTRKRSFYLHDWSLDVIEEAFPQGYRVGQPVPFRDGRMVVIRGSQ